MNNFNFESDEEFDRLVERKEREIAALREKILGQLRELNELVLKIFPPSSEIKNPPEEGF